VSAGLQTMAPDLDGKKWMKSKHRIAPIKVCLLSQAREMYQDLAQVT
jgi:hypothetical protein